MTELPPKTPAMTSPPQTGFEEQKQTYRQVLLCVFIATVCVAVVLPVVFAFSKFQSILFFVIGAGVIGALFSSLVRLYHYEDLPKALTGTGLGLTNFYLIIYAIIPLVIGAIAATALYLAFMSGLLKGDLFPAFGCPGGSDDCPLETFAPTAPAQYAKALLWGFLSGFSERLVPDLLQNIAKTKDK